MLRSFYCVAARTNRDHVYCMSQHPLKLFLCLEVRGLPAARPQSEKAMRVVMPQSKLWNGIILVLRFLIL
jgi:hypothetical protein